MHAPPWRRASARTRGRPWAGCRPVCAPSALPRRSAQRPFGQPAVSTTAAMPGRSSGQSVSSGDSASSSIFHAAQPASSAASALAASTKAGRHDGTGQRSRTKATSRTSSAARSRGPHASSHTPSQCACATQHWRRQSQRAHSSPLARPHACASAAVAEVRHWRSPSAERSTKRSCASPRAASSSPVEGAAARGSTSAVAHVSEPTTFEKEATGRGKAAGRRERRRSHPRGQAPTTQSAAPASCASPPPPRAADTQTGSYGGRRCAWTRRSRRRTFRFRQCYLISGEKWVELRKNWVEITPAFNKRETLFRPHVSDIPPPCEQTKINQIACL